MDTESHSVIGPCTQVVKMSSVKVDCVVKTSALIGEGPVWEESDQTLLFVDIVGQKIHRWSPATNQIQSMETGGPISILTCLKPT